MDREVASTINLATILIAISAVLLIIMYTVMVGNELKLNLIDKGVNVQAQLESSQLQSLNGKEPKVLPKAAVYTMMAKEKNYIESLFAYGVTYVIDSKGLWVDENYKDMGSVEGVSKYIFPEDIILNNMKGKAIIEVEKNDTGMYAIKLSELVED